MKWYEKKFSEFFSKWKKGDIFLKTGQGYFGEVENIEFATRFGDSTVGFVCYELDGTHKTIPLAEIRHFHAFNGPILNIGKYVKIVQLEEASYLSVIDGGRIEESVKQKLKVVKEVEDEKGEHEPDPATDRVICLAFGLEFYTDENTARMLQRDIKKLLLSKLGDVPLLSVDDRAAVDLTPTFSKWHVNLSERLQNRQSRHKGRHTGENRYPRSAEPVKNPKEEIKK